jgi:hypothetical protein
MKKITLIICTLVLLLFACSETASDSVDQVYLDQADELRSTLPFLVINKEKFDILNINRKNNISNGDTFKFESIKRNKDKLELTVSYSGGCELHYLNVNWDGIIYTDDPCHVSLIITHNSNNDKCESYVTKTFYINLKDLVGDISYKDICEYHIYSTFNSSDTPDLKITN